MDRLNKISLLEKLKNNEITLDELKRQSNGDNLPAMVICSRVDPNGLMLYEYEGGLYSREYITEMEAKRTSTAPLFIEFTGDLVPGKKLRELLY